MSGLMKNKTKGIGLLSGGLDSLLAVKVLQEQDIDIIGVTFTTPFFGSEPGIRICPTTGITLHVTDIGEKHLKMLRNPVYGYGSQMNPCIDCHALMIREAGRLMESEGADFIFTGEVLGQRPMSQRRDSLRSVENLAGYPGRVLRPLSAKLLTPTIAEVQGLIDREKLLDIQGRSRKRQVALAGHYAIRDYPQPGGGCMLTNEGFAARLKELFRSYPEASLREVKAIKWGRYFRLPAGNVCLIGRNQSDNEKLELLATSDDLMARARDYPGPVGLLLSPSLVGEDLDLAARLVAAYSDAPSEAMVEVEWEHEGKSGIVVARRTARDDFRQYLV
jgi:tRNA U34 2-thiouridine synthase MnmA/TrmU